jgi:hypothetical protein
MPASDSIDAEAVREPLEVTAGGAGGGTSGQCRTIQPGDPIRSAPLLDTWEIEETTSSTQKKNSIKLTRIDGVFDIQDEVMTLETTSKRFRPRRLDWVE